jgi:hypothetical protein
MPRSKLVVSLVVFVAIDQKIHLEESDL